MSATISPTEIVFTCDRCGAQSATCCTYRVMPAECVWTGDTVVLSLLGLDVRFTITSIVRRGALVIMSTESGETIVRLMGTPTNVVI